MLPAEAGAEAAAVLTRLETALSGPAGRIAAGLRFDGSGATFQLAVPLAALEAMASLSPAATGAHQPTAPEPERADPAPSGP
jgi:hypothetical protein